MRWRLDVRQLHQPAALAHHHRQRIKRLSVVQNPVSGAKLIGNGAEAQVQHGTCERSTAEAAATTHDVFPATGSNCRICCCVSSHMSRPVPCARYHSAALSTAVASVQRGCHPSSVSACVLS